MGFFKAGCVRCTMLALGLTSFACENTGKSGENAVGEAERLSVSGSSVVLGFKSGKLRATIGVRSFEITPTPVSSEQYARCVEQSACPPLLGAAAHAPIGESDETSRAQSPREQSQIERGASAEGALAFCRWVGGELPSLPQWLLAARGPTPQRFAWGDRLPTCEEHPGGVSVRRALDERADALERARAAARQEPCGSSLSLRYALDQHPAATSPKGLKDVLLASSELLRKDAESPFGSCRGEQGLCSVYGASPGAIDYVREVAASAADEQALGFGFRCVWNGEGAK